MAEEIDKQVVEKEENKNENQDDLNGYEEESAINFVNGQLSYLGQDIETIPDSIRNDYSKDTRRLDLSFNRLQNLNGLEEFTNLEELILDNNMIGDSTDFPRLKSLHTLTINKNNITNLDHLLDSLQNKFLSLTYLSLLGNKACPNQLSCLDKDEEDYRRYRNYVLYRLPNLKFLDSTPVKPSELAEAKRVGPFMKVVKLDESEITDKTENEPETTEKSKYSPLPASHRETNDHLGSFGKSKYVYYGRHSEGNRFIRNNDL